VIRASADRVFQEQKAKTEKNPDDWREWFALSLAYDAAGDRSRARKAMREALVKASE
jgi:Flp pilus assembly protein TadD